jgi:tetratricopeptide (TPR) repeat protein
MQTIAFLLPLLLSGSMLRAETIPGLGTATFPTSTHNAEAQHDFLRGLLLLHVFEYDDADKSFVAAEKLDPTFALAYWGDAMTFNHPVWNQLDVPAGQAALARFAPTAEARAARIADPRERDWMSAVEILYSGRATKPQRDAEYAVAMQHLSQVFPDDESKLFYSLALLGRSEGVRDVPTYLQAAAIAKAVFERNPDHPGAAHYWIHGMDDPQHAAGALVAARALSRIAPDAGHAQHMCSHIFMALGMWDEVVDANINAMRVEDDHDRAAGIPVWECGHYDIWLEYGYYQQGRIDLGGRTLAACQTTGAAFAAWATSQPGKTPTRTSGTNASLVHMRGIAVIETQNWTGPAATMTLDIAALPPILQSLDTFATGYAAAQRGNTNLAAIQLSGLQSLANRTANQPNADPEDIADSRILTIQLSGLIAFKAGQNDAAIAQLQQAAATFDALPVDFGPPVTLKPPQELLGELLLAQKQYAKAREAFTTSLTQTPRRTQSLLGLGRSEAAMNNTAAATASYKELLQIWHNADPGYAPKLEAEHFLATHQPS